MAEISNWYRPVTQEAFAKRQEEFADESDYWKPKAGRNMVRPLSAHIAAQSPDPIVMTYMHYRLGPDGKLSIQCRLKLGADFDPVCARIDEVQMAVRTEPDPARIKKMLGWVDEARVQKRYYIQVVDMAHPENGPQIWGMSTNTHRKTRACFYNDEGAWRDITHPETGRTLIIQGIQNGEWVKPETIRPAESASRLLDMDWLKTMRNLDEAVFIPTAEEATAVLEGQRPQRRFFTTGRPPAGHPALGPGVTPPAQTSLLPPGSAAPAQARVVTPPLESSAVTPPVATVSAPPAPSQARVATVVGEPVKRGPGRPRKAAAKVGEAPVASNGKPYAAARAECARQGFLTPTDITPAELPEFHKPECYTLESDPQDPTCQICPVLLPCLTERLKLAA